jgi:hypothetical protein
VNLLFLGLQRPQLMLTLSDLLQLFVLCAFALIFIVLYFAVTIIDGCQRVVRWFRKRKEGPR